MIMGGRVICFLISLMLYRTLVAKVSEAALFVVKHGSTDEADDISTSGCKEAMVT